MRIYLAGRYSRRLELREHAIELQDMGHTVVSTWLNGTHDIPESANDETRLMMRSEFAKCDMLDVLRADCMISFAETPRTPTRGGRHVEFGLALATNKLLIVVGGGEPETVFHCLGQVFHVHDWYGVVHYLSGIGFKR